MTVNGPIRIALLAMCLASTSVSAQEATATSPSKLSRAAVGLGSCDGEAATEYLEYLFDAGQEAIPYLVASFGDKRPFLGSCGSKVLDSTNFPAEPSLSRPPSALPEVREVALYVLLGILKGSKYFAGDCRIERGGGVESREVSVALGEIAVLYVQAQIWETALETEMVEGILTAHALRFPAHGSGLRDRPQHTGSR